MYKVEATSPERDAKGFQLRREGGSVPLLFTYKMCMFKISQIYVLHYVHLKMQSDSRKARGTAAEKGMRRVTAERPVA